LFAAIDEARSTQGAEAVITRIYPKETAGFCDKIPVSDFDLDTLKSVYGPGKYVIRFRGPKGFIKGGATVKIAPPPSGGGGSRGGQAPAGGEYMTPLDFFKLQMEQERLARDKSQARFDQILAIGIPSLTSILTALVSRPGGPDLTALLGVLKPAPSPTMAELTQSLANLKALSAPPESSDSKIDQALKIMEAVKDFSDNAGGSGEGKSTWIDIVRDLIKAAPAALQPMLEARMAAMQSRAPVAPVAVTKPIVAPPAPKIVPAPIAPPVPVVPAADVSAGVAADSSGGDMNALNLFKPQIKAKLAQVVIWAQKDRDPYSYAQIFCDEIPEQAWKLIGQEKALDYLNHADWWKVVCEWEPNLAPHQKWCEEFRQNLIEIVSAGLDDSEPPPTEETPTVTTQVAPTVIVPPEARIPSRGDGM
jgi:hypothetical protein